MAEIGRVGVADLIGNLRNLPATFQQQGAGQFHSLLPHILQERPAVLMAECAAQGGLAHPQLASKACSSGRGIQVCIKLATRFNGQIAVPPVLGLFGRSVADQVAGQLQHDGQAQAFAMQAPECARVGR
ncbi:hypothetical protein D3C80_1268260 [compost metagenome]